MWGTFQVPPMTHLVLYQVGHGPKIWAQVDDDVIEAAAIDSITDDL